MPFFDANKFQISIDIDPPGFAFVGGVITGVCRIVCSEPATARGIVLGYKVTLEERMNAVADAHSVVDEEVNRLVEKKFANMSTMMHSAEYLLFGSRSGSVVTIKPGTYSYPFMIPVPRDVPPTLAGNAGHGSNCCTCCCQCCGYAETFIAVAHHLSATVVIAYSLKDAVVYWPVKVRSGINEDEYMRQGQVSLTTVGNNASCATCCPCLTSCFPLKPHNGITMTVDKGIIALDRDRGVNVWVHGNILYDFDIVLMSRQADPQIKEAERVWLTSGRGKFRRPPSGLVPPETPIHCFFDLSRAAPALWNVPTARITSAASASKLAFYLPFTIEYYLAIEFVYEDGVCQGPATKADLPTVPLRFVHSASSFVPPSSITMMMSYANTNRNSGVYPPPPQHYNNQGYAPGYVQQSGQQPYGYPREGSAAPGYPPLNAPQPLLMVPSTGAYPPPPPLYQPPPQQAPQFFAQCNTVTYQYVPPAPLGVPEGGAPPPWAAHNFTPAAPVQEPNLPPAVWGEPLEFHLPNPM